MSDSLTPSQINRLEKLEAIIRQGLQTFAEVGAALCAIREHKLYLRDFDTFEAYCQSRWGWSRQRSLQLINAAELVESLPPTLAAKVETERDARALLQLEPAEQKQVIREAQKEGVPISEKAKSFSEKPVSIAPTVTTVVVKAPRTDCLNRVIPDEVIPDWDRAVEVGNHLRGLLSEVKLAVEKGIKNKDLVFLEITNPTVSEAEGLRYTLSQIIPYVVCTTCQGRGRKSCLFCRGRGWISKYLYNSSAVSKAAKAILERGMTK